MTFGLDYSGGMPPIDTMKAAGVQFVCRYVGYTSPELPQTKILTLDEAKTLGQGGLALVSNWEWYANRATEGSAAGVWDAQEAKRRHSACGGPPDRPIYFSVDFDASGEQVADYFRGVAQGIGLSRTAAYGSFKVLQYLFDNHLISWGWQTYAWSYGQWEPRAHIRQYSNGMVMAGLSVDYNESLKSDFGQWLYGEGGPLVSIDLSNPVVAGYFTLVNGNQWQCKNTGKIIHGEILATYQRYGNDALCGLTDWGLPVSNEIPLDSNGNVKQHFERVVVFFDPNHVHDKPPGAGRVYTAHLYSGPGQDPEIAVLQADLAKATAPVIQGIDPVKIKAFQTSAGLKTHALVQGVQDLEAFITTATF